MAGTQAARRPHRNLPGESPDERGPGGERGVRGESGGSGSEEVSGTNLAPNETSDAVRGGARVFLYYDAGADAFVDTVEDTTSNVLSQVRVEVHLSNGTELGPTTRWTWLPARRYWSNCPPHARVLHRMDRPCRGGR